MLDKTKTSLLHWMPDWKDQCVAIVGSGNSVRRDEVDMLRERIHVVAVNNSYELCPWADMLYACDARWWELKKGVPQFGGIKVCQETKAHEMYSDINLVSIRRESGTPVHRFLFDKMGQIGGGGNSGFQALNIVAQMGVSDVMLLGFDMVTINGKLHWHGRHPDSGFVLYNPDEFAFRRWVDRMTKSAPALKQRGVNVINCSAQSALTCFPKMTVEQTLKEWGL